MLSSVLNSERAVQVNIAIMRTFVQLRWLMDSNADLARKIESLEKKYDEKFATVFAAIKQLIAPTEPAKKTDWISPLISLPRHSPATAGLLPAIPRPLPARHLFASGRIRRGGSLVTLPSMSLLAVAPFLLSLRLSYSSLEVIIV